MTWLRRTLGRAKDIYVLVSGVLLLTLVFWTIGAAASANQGGANRTEIAETTTTETTTTDPTPPEPTTGPTTPGTMTTATTSTEVVGKEHTPVTICHRTGN